MEEEEEKRQTQEVEEATDEGITEIADPSAAADEEEKPATEVDSLMAIPEPEVCFCNISLLFCILPHILCNKSLSNLTKDQGKDTLNRRKQTGPLSHSEQIKVIRTTLTKFSDSHLQVNVLILQN